MTAASRDLFAGWDGEDANPNKGDVIRRVRLCFVGEDALGICEEDEDDTAAANEVALFSRCRCRFSRGLGPCCAPMRGLLVWTIDIDDEEIEE